MHLHSATAFQTNPEMRQRDELITSHPVPQSQQVPARQIPPIKPRRSIKSRPAEKEEAGPSNPLTNGKEREPAVQRPSPAVLRSGAPGPLEALSPTLRAHTLLWFERSQLPRLRRPGQPLPSWLHGFATRREAEELLKDEPDGCFLVRLSESKIGFVLSYRGRDRCRHFILEEEEGGSTPGGRQYLIAGEQSRHGSLQELINYYTQHAVGPFDEVLTIPCVKGKRGCEDLAGQGDGARGGLIPWAELEHSVSPAPVSPTSPAPATPPPGTAQYAVVRKPMKKSSSFSERLINENIEVPDFTPAAPPKTTGPESNLPSAEPEEPQYARVNKPPRSSAGTAHPSSSLSAGAQPEPHPGPYPALHSGVAPPLRGAGDTLGEGKYWELVPMHTYEETHHMPRPDESPDHIEFYAMARRQDVMQSEEGANNHLYSEVNLRGSRVVPSTTPLPPPTRNAPGLPLRPPPRLTDCPAHPDSTLQRMDGWPAQPGPAPSLPGSCSPIYEQIPEGGLSARPPLPRQNHTD